MRLLLEAGRARGAALLHAEACALLRRAMPEGKVPRLRAVWLDPPDALAPVPRLAELQAMADGLRALLRAASPAREAPPPTPKARSEPKPPTEPKPKLKPKPGRTPPPPRPAEAPVPRRPVSSAAFWALIDRWGVGDEDALALLGHAGGLTARGTRPRFRLAPDEAERFALLQSLDDACAALGQSARDTLPFDDMRRGGEDAIRAALKRVEGEGWRRSLRA